MVASWRALALHRDGLPHRQRPSLALVLLNLSLADVREDEFRLRVGTLVMMAFSVFSFMPKRALGYLSQVAEFIACGGPSARTLGELE